jgi:hypothetical protein
MIKFELSREFFTPLKIYIILFLITSILIIGLSKSNDEDDDKYYSKYDDPYYNRFDKINRYQVKDVYL